MSAKTCFKCHTEKPLSDFYRHSRMADGYLNKCKDCTKSDVARHRSENIDKVRAYDRSRSKLPHRIDGMKHIVGRWIEANPKRRAANVAVGNAVRDGRLKKLPCFVCGESAEAHHPDYDRPLDVVWLCSAHHKQAHAITRKVA